MLGLVVAACLFLFEFPSICRGQRLEGGRHGQEGVRRQGPNPLGELCSERCPYRAHVWLSAPGPGDVPSPGNIALGSSLSHFPSRPM